MHPDTFARKCSELRSEWDLELAAREARRGNPHRTSPKRLGKGYSVFEALVSTRSMSGNLAYLITLPHLHVEFQKRLFQSGSLTRGLESNQCCDLI